MRNMTQEQQRKCNQIIHSHAVAIAVGNAVPVPGLGFATDTIAMTTMAMSLSGVFGSDLKEGVARNLAITTLKRTVLKQPIRIMAKELSKLLPRLGLVVAPTVSVAMLEAAGWSMANEMATKTAVA